MGETLVRHHKARIASNSFLQSGHAGGAAEALPEQSRKPALRDPSRQFRRLPDPARDQFLVELIILVDVEVARVLGLGFARREWAQRGAPEERDFDVLREAMEVEEPAPVLDAIEGRVPL